VRRRRLRPNHVGKEQGNEGWKTRERVRLFRRRDRVSNQSEGVEQLIAFMESGFLYLSVFLLY
jgi:hypothetical protein